MKSRSLTIVLIITSCLQGVAQNRTVDSLRNSLKTEQSIAGKASTLNNLCAILCVTAKYDSSMAYASKAIALEEKIISSTDSSVSIIGENYMARTYRIIGVIYRHLGNYSKSLEYDFKALDLSQKTDNKDGIAANLGNIGVVYWGFGDYEKALGYFLKALAINEKTGNKSLMAADIGNIGILYRLQGNYAKALEYDFKALATYKELDDKDGVATNLGNIGLIYMSQGNYSKALEYDTKALSNVRELGEQPGLATNFVSIGDIYTRLKKYSLARKYYDSSLFIAESTKEKGQIRDTYSSIYFLDSASGNYYAEAEDYKKYIIYRDSMQNEANTKKILQVQMSYDFDKKTDSSKAAQEKLNLITAKESQHQKMILYSFIGGFVVMLVLALLILIGYRQKQSANKVITHQKELVEEKNKEILDSMTYAKRLQDAILPPLSLVKKFFPESFVFYQPKDIVAGDFYWMERVGDNILIAAADCTGHGVPGALVSVVCSNALNRTVKEFHIIETGKILDKVRELVLETFEKSESNVQDGMDVSLCCINTKTKEAQWSGAYNLLWYIRHGELIEINGDKQPIGKNSNPTPFNTHNLELQKGDMLYLFTDGYADQFGGPKGKKLKYKQLQDVLLANASRSMDEQKTILQSHLSDWKGNLEQVDDILVIGIRV